MRETRLQKDQRILSKIFPEMVWLFVYNHMMKSLQSVENIYHASAFFQHVLHFRRNEFLFKRVLSIVVLKEFFTEMTANKPFSANPTLLKLRLICRSWCTTVEQDMLLFCFKSKIHHKAISVSNAVDDEAEFMSHFEESHSGLSHNKSPFILNTVSFIVDWNNPGINVPNFEVPLNLLLPKYGNHIHHCSMIFPCSLMPKRWFENAVVQMAFWMPNVKNLKLNLYPRELITHGYPDILPDVTDLPEFESLTSLTMSTATNLGAITSKLLCKMPNLRKLCMVLMQTISRPQNLLPRLTTSKLQRLELFYARGGGYSEPNQEYLADHPTNQPHRCLLDAGLHAIFQTLEAHSPMNSLRTLKVSLMCALPSTWHGWQKYTINLPNLVDFTLYSWTWPCIDMALLFRDSLENVTLRLETVQTFEVWKQAQGAKELMESEQIKYLSNNAKFDKESNIWKEMRKLKDVTTILRLPGHQQNLVQRFRPSRHN